MNVVTRIEGRAGRITLNRPAALNALTHAMTLHIAAALTAWRDDPAVMVVLIDSANARAFCAGGDIASIYAQFLAGDYEPGRRFWRDEYRMNAQIARYPKPIVSFLNGFVMGGGVGIGCHASHRIVGDTSRVAMPECSIGLVPDVGGTLLLARAPGRLGEFLTLTAARMTGADAIHAGFADFFIAEADWDDLKAALTLSGDIGVINGASVPPPPSTLAAAGGEIDQLFSSGDLAGVLAALAAGVSDFAKDAAKRGAGNAPLAMAASLRLLAEARKTGDIESALTREYRYVYRTGTQGDFAEGIRARIIDKDNRPQWRHSLTNLPTEAEVAAMLAPLGPEDLTWESDR